MHVKFYQENACEVTQLEGNAINEFFLDTLMQKYLTNINFLITNISQEEKIWYALGKCV